QAIEVEVVAEPGGEAVVMAIEHFGERQLRGCEVAAVTFGYRGEEPRPELVGVEQTVKRSAPDPAGGVGRPLGSVIQFEPGTRVGLRSAEPDLVALDWAMARGSRRAANDLGGGESGLDIEQPQALHCAPGG